MRKKFHLSPCGSRALSVRSSSDLGTPAQTPKTEASDEAASPDTKTKQDTRRAYEALKKKHLTRLKFHDLTNLPLVAILSRRPTSLVLLVKRHGGEDEDLSLNKSVVVKLFACKKGTLKESSVLEEYQTIRNTVDLNLSERPFFRELIFLSCLQRDQDGAQAGVVRLLGWGIAENYKGVVLEALRGPNLHDVIVKSAPHGKQSGDSKLYNPPPHLRLLFRLHWAFQVCKLTAAVHRRGIIHRDIKAENFAFRSPASDRCFGSLTLFDFDRGTFERPHCNSLERPVYSNPNTSEYRGLTDQERALLECSIDLIEDHPAVAAETVRPPCLHWPLSPPSPSAPAANWEAPEAAYCTAGPECPQSCRAVDRIRAESKALIDSRRIGVQRRVEYPVEASDGKCACPSCECYQGRMDSWSLGVLIGQLFEVFASTDGMPRLSECLLCGERMPLSSDAIDRWASEVSQVIDQVALKSYNVAFDPSLVPEVKPTMLFGPSSQSVSDFLLAHKAPPARRSMDHYFYRPPSAGYDERPGHTHYRQLARLTEWRRRWTKTSETVRATILDLVQRATSRTAHKRPTSAQMRNILKDLLDEVLSFHTQCQLMRLPISGLTLCDSST